MSKTQGVNYGTEFDRLAGLAGTQGVNYGNRFDGLGADARAAGDAGAGQFGDLYNRQMGIATGQDPRFANFANSQRNILRTQTAQQQSQASDMFGKRGLGESSAALNALTGIQGQGQMQERNMLAQLGLQEMGRQDQALNLAAGLTGQQMGARMGGIQGQGQFGQAGLGARMGGIQGQGQLSQAGLGARMGGIGTALNAEQLGMGAAGKQLDYYSAGLQNLLAGPTMGIAMTAAQNSGKLPPEKDPGLLGGVFDIFGI